ncbi:thioredoxin-dependent thiol peroxidase [Leucobacter chromiireducens]|uniref:thioredoxin-dependent peroxiredoxin n=1 Tax=Leucobacter chromiireducens subsp. solipictus TaxID=398235 RepID=A0ABS1SC14_9MICO|nr:thioredoxin-dependent thiol peroxidase [Leucobacter chromiireducens]MBL3678085.1 thioredoxin-dependent thiol peroxidase [Leucobacter chromiireducens subsp. solipictus]
MTARVILEPGQAAPDFSLPDQDGVTRSLSDYRGEKVILFVYPQAMTPACTTEACEFQESTAPLAAAGYRVLGLSRDSVEKLRRFADRDALEYPLLSDPEHAVHEAYGAYGEKNSYGRIVEGVIRSTFVIDEAGKIEHALYNIKATGHVARVRKLVGADAA